MKENKEKTMVILQPSYLPWIGFFEQVYRSDIFVLYDDVQFCKNDWRNRNRLKGANGVFWITVPVLHKLGQLIKDVKVDNKVPWAKQHIKMIQMSYGRSPFFNDYFSGVRKILEKERIFLFDVVLDFIYHFTEILGLKREFIVSSKKNYPFFNTPVERLFHICKEEGCAKYYNGAIGRTLYNEQEFREQGIELGFQDYQHPVYQQRWGDFVSHLSILDLLFNEGPKSLGIIINKKA